MPASGTWSPGAPSAGERPREVIDHAIAPVWEANHVWLIFVFVLLWTCFPEAYASITLTIFVPLTLAALGIVLRGASFAFRKAVFRTRDRRNFGAAFALSSVLVPYCFGAVVGGIASGRVPAGGKAGDPWDSWVNPTSILGGLLAVCLDGLPGRVLPGPRRRPALRRDDGGVLPPPGHRGRGRGRRGGGRSGSSCCQRRRVPLRRPHLAGPAAGHPLRACAVWPPWCWSPAASARGARLAAVVARWPAWSWPGAWRSGTTCSPTSPDRLRGGRTDGHHHGRAGRHRASPWS